MIRMLLVTLSVPFCLPQFSEAADPPVGTTLTLPAVSVSVSADGAERDSKRGVYAPPPGWYVRSHRVVVANRAGSVSYSVSTVPAGWVWQSQDFVPTSQSYRCCCVRQDFLTLPPAILPRKI